MSFYQNMQKIAADVLKRFDQGGIAYIEMKPGEGGTRANPANPVPVRHPIDGATARGASFKYIQRGLAVATDVQVTFAGSQRFEPIKGGFIEVDGRRLTVSEVIRKPLAGTPVAYTLIAR